jgi:hypothetical protein
MVTICNLLPNSPKGREALLQLVNFKKLKKDLKNNLISRDNYSVESSKITHACILIIEDLKPEDITLSITTKNSRIKDEVGELIYLNIFSEKHNQNFEIRIGLREKNISILYNTMLSYPDYFPENEYSQLYYPVLKRTGQNLVNSMQLRDFDIKNGEEILLKSIPIDHAKGVALLREFLELLRLLKFLDKIILKNVEFDPENVINSLIFEYKLRSIIGINEDLSPIYGDSHKLKISHNLRNFKVYSCRFITRVWHPNIKHIHRNGGIVQHLGYLSENELNWKSLSGIIIEIGKMLQFKLYDAEISPPYPEDMKVAQWVRNYGEVNGIVNKSMGIFIDNSSLI